jgi:2-hydroxy-3-keto-5-methylthiopentenyl-1-phosphate phosphatase
MSRSSLTPALFFDFDNTLTDGDVLDGLIESYSPNHAWRDWEHAWSEGQLSARDCLRLQVQNMRVRRETLLDHVAGVRIDPWFPETLEWAKRRGIEVTIVSDSFAPLIKHILSSNGIHNVAVFANDLEFAGDRLIPSFPFYHPACTSSANAKAHHLTPYRGYRIIFAGDGHSDLDAALAADVVFAKSTLAKELDMRGVAFFPFDRLQPVLAFLESSGVALAGAPMRTRRDQPVAEETSTG